MRHNLPGVHLSPASQTPHLYGWTRQPPTQKFEIALDSPAWFSWLAHRQSFRLIYYPASGGFINLTVRPEKRGPHTYWQAWKTIRGRTLKKYIGPSVRLTRAKLETVSQWFVEQSQTRCQADPSMVFFAAASDLIWLAERLMEHCPHPTLVQQAQQELARIKRKVAQADHPQDQGP